MISIRSSSEIKKINAAGNAVALILNKIKQEIKPGLTTQDLEDLASSEVKRLGVVAAFKGVGSSSGRPYPACLCTSINDEIVHGIPSRKKIIKDGDLLSIDFGVCLDGYFGDAAISVCVGTSKPAALSLIKTAEEALATGIAEAVPGRRLGDLCSAIQSVVEKAGYAVIREFVGHGIGTALHEDPQIPNYGEKGTGVTLKEGMVLAIEPMIQEKNGCAVIDRDGWTARTNGGWLAAHAEHTIAITKYGPKILTRF